MDTELARQAADPATPQEVLADLAYRHPELRPLVAANPTTYEGLREWLRALGDPAVDRVLGGRAQGNPADHRRFPWPWVIAGAAGVVALVLVAVILWPRAIENQSVTAPLAGTMPAPTSTPLAEAVPARDGSYPGVSTTSLPQLPIAPQTVTADYGSENSVQRFADDVAAGNVDRLVEKCWTYAPATVRDRYGTDQARGAILDAFAHPGRYTQGGAIWEGGEITVDVRNEELVSTYACPDIIINGAPDELNFVDAEYLVARLYGRLLGTPVSLGDTEFSYYLLCDTDWELSGSSGAEPPILANPADVNAAIELLGNHELAVRKVVGEYVRDYYVLTRLDASSTASLVLQKTGPRVCVGDGSTP